MGRTNPSRGLPPPTQRKEARAKEARSLVNKTIPAILASDARARKGIDATELIVDPPRSQSRSHEPQAQDVPFVLRLIIGDTISAASQMSSTSKSKRNVAVLNMASPLRPGGGFLNGATSQEETLCLRTTLYPSLREEFYRLPEVGVIFTPDVFVFRDEMGADLEKGKRWYIDVISAGMLRFPDIEDDDVREKDNDDRESTGNKQSEGVKYSSMADRRMVEMKMRAVMRVLCLKRVERVVFGAWGCGAYGNPVTEIATAWRKVLLGERNQQEYNNQHRQFENQGEYWHSLREIVFAIKDKKMAQSFAECFGSELKVENEIKGTLREESEDDKVSTNTRELKAKIEEMEVQIGQVQNVILKSRLEDILQGLNKELSALKIEEGKDDLINQSKDVIKDNATNIEENANYDEHYDSYSESVEPTAPQRKTNMQKRTTKSKKGHVGINQEETLFDDKFFDNNSLQKKLRHNAW